MVPVEAALTTMWSSLTTGPDVLDEDEYLTLQEEVPEEVPE